MELTNLRNSIDTIDDEILSLLEKRMGFVKQIGVLKAGSKTPVYRPERERAIIERLSSKASTLNKEAIEAIFMEVFAVSRNLEKPEKVAFLGPVGTHTHQAAQSRFGAMSSYQPLNSVEAVFKEVANKEAKFGVVPVENNTEGAVGATLDCLAKFENVKIVAEIYADIHHSFASLSQNAGDIERIYSHPQAYNQCRNFLESHGLLDAEFIPTKSTAEAAFKALGDKFSGAICPKIAANLNRVPLMFECIEDNSANRTRFFVLSDFKNGVSAGCKSSILAKTSHESGSLTNLLMMFKDAGINLTKLESRPVKQRDFHVVFYIDFEGHIDEEKVREVIKKASECGCEISWLGSYVGME